MPKYLITVKQKTPTGRHMTASFMSGNVLRTIHVADECTTCQGAGEVVEFPSGKIKPCPACSK